MPAAIAGLQIPLQLQSTEVPATGSSGPGLLRRSECENITFLIRDFSYQHMKRVPSVLILILVVMSVLVTGPVAAQASDDGNPLNSLLDSTTAEIKNPFLSPCSSPAWKLIFTYVTNPGEEFNADHCIQFFAVQAGDTSQCADIKRGAPKTKCFVMIAGNKNDPAICNKIPTTSDPQAYLKVDCLWEVAIKNNNQAACNAMGSQKISRMFVGEMSKQTCLARLASGEGVGGSTL
jgi:hypothetical protein